MTDNRLQQQRGSASLTTLFGADAFAMSVYCYNNPQAIETANLEAGKAKDQCNAVTHDAPSIGGLVSIAPIVFAERLLGTPIREVQQIYRQHLFLTHPDEELAAVCAVYVEPLDNLLFRNEQESAETLLVRAAKTSIGLGLAALVAKARSDREIVGSLFRAPVTSADPGRACSIWLTDIWVNKNMGCSPTPISAAIMSTVARCRAVFSAWQILPAWTHPSDGRSGGDRSGSHLRSHQSGNAQGLAAEGGHRRYTLGNAALHPGC